MRARRWAAADRPRARAKTPSRRVLLLYAAHTWESPPIAAARPASPPASLHEIETLPCPRTGAIALSYRAYRKMRTMSNPVTRRSGLRPRLLLVSAALVLGAMSGACVAGVPQIVHARQDHFKTLGRTFKSLRDQIGRSRPNWNLVADDANRIERLAAALPSWFPAGSGEGSGVRTRASATIWSQPRVFARAARKLLTRAQAVHRAAAGRDLGALRVRTRALGQACGSCHRRFRAHGSWW